jgi:predicted nucleotidyltransferase
MQNPFRSVTDEYVERLRAYYGDRLIAIYRVGSVARGEAVPGLSDLNLLGVLHEAGPDAEGEAAWHQEAARVLAARHPELARPDTDPDFTFAPILLAEACPDEPAHEPRDDVLELHWGGELLWGEDIRDRMPACPPPRLPSAREWTARAGQILSAATERRAHLRLAGHRAAKAALTGCLAVGVAQGQGFTLLSDVIAARTSEHHPDWAAWAGEFARSFRDPPGTPEQLDALLEAAHVLLDWTGTILYAIGRPHSMRV